MPYGPGTYGGGVGTLGPANALAAQTSPAATQASSQQQALSEVMMMLTSGQAGAERLLAMLAMLAQSTLPQMAQQMQGQPGGAPPSIQGLLG